MYLRTVVFNLIPTFLHIAIAVSAFQLLLLSLAFSEIAQRVITVYGIEALQYVSLQDECVFFVSL